MLGTPVIINSVHSTRQIHKPPSCLQKKQNYTQQHSTTSLYNSRKQFKLHFLIHSRLDFLVLLQVRGWQGSNLLSPYSVKTSMHSDWNESHCAVLSCDDVISKFVFNLFLILYLFVLSNDRQEGWKTYMISSLVNASHHIVITASYYDAIRTLPLNAIKLQTNRQCC